MASAWTAAQQQALEEALRRYPAATEKRWRLVGAAMQAHGKTRQQCVERYRHICALLRLKREERDVDEGRRAAEAVAH